MYNVIATLFSIIIPIIILRKDFRKKDNILSCIKENRLIIFAYIIFVIGFLTRFIGIVNFPNGLNTDEASIGYEAYSVLNYGIDRNANSYPVFLEAWGSGQNALYMYIIIPFVKILGLNILSVRLPMAIIGCTSLIIMYKLLLKMEKKKFAVLGLAFFAITPWHIMKSRYGLESNVFPDFTLYAVYFIISALKEKKCWKFYLGAVFLGLCSYSYGTSYYFLPIFVIISLTLLLIKKKIKIKEGVCFLGIVFIISFPIVLMILINTFKLKEIHIGKITIPRLTQNRYEELTVLSSENIIITLWQNFYNSLKMLLLQTDGYNSNSLEFFGIIYIFSFPIAIIGGITSFKRKEESNTIFNIWFIVAFLLTLICKPNINRMNILYVPVIFYTIIGIYEIVSTFKWAKSVLFLLYLVSFIIFEITYFNTDTTKTYTFSNGIQNVIQYTKNVKADSIYFEYSFKEPYIYILFFNQGDTREFIKTVKHKNNIKTFNSVTEFGKYKFYLPKRIEQNENSCYIMTKKTKKKYKIDENIWKITYIDNFCVLERK